VFSLKQTYSKINSLNLAVISGKKPSLAEINIVFNELIYYLQVELEILGFDADDIDSIFQQAMIAQFINDNEYWEDKFVKLKNNSLSQEELRVLLNSMLTLSYQLLQISQSGNI